MMIKSEEKIRKKEVSLKSKFLKYAFLMLKIRRVKI